MKKRASGILLHITSLPSTYPIGDLGPGAYRFADFLAKSGQGFWQILPLNPTSKEAGHSPYSSCSAFAGNPLLISPVLLCQEGWLQESESRLPDESEAEEVDYLQAEKTKYPLLELAFAKFKSLPACVDFKRFCQNQSFWLNDFALFCSLKKKFPFLYWKDWPKEFQRKQLNTRELEEDPFFAEEILKQKFWQYLFQTQWKKLKSYCNSLGIHIIGDLPIYVSYDSADVWANPEYFHLDENLNPVHVAGVPPDYFSSTGQLWGNPVYNWESLKKDGFSWWLQRLKLNFELYDFIRIDHFRGLVAFWQVPSSEETAINGHWVQTPVYDFLDTVLKYYPSLPIIAEDLGVITSDVKEVLNYYGLPGMRLLLFAFGDGSGRHPFLPHNYPQNCVAYTGTHDTNTVLGWLKQEAGPAEKDHLAKYLGREIETLELNWELIRLGLMSRANLMLMPMQDLLGLGEQARMNRPSTAQGNWTWRLAWEQLRQAPAERLAEMTRIYGRNL